MAEQKRYYWLKLHDDFFSSIRIKKLRKMAGGDTYVIIYLKMQLKAIKTDGCLSWKGYEQDFVDELALDIDEEPDNVRVTLAYLISCGLAETDGNTNFFLPYAIENTGSESSAAERMRKMRERNNVTPMLQDRYVEKEKDIDKEKDIERDSIKSSHNTNVSEKSNNSTNSDEFVCRTKDVRRVMEAWNSLGLSQIQKILPDTNRGMMLRKRIQDYGVDAVCDAIEKVRGSTFLMGGNKKGWTITFDWFIKPNNFPKVMEGNYDDHAEAKSSAKIKTPYDGLRSETHGDDLDRLSLMFNTEKEG